MKIVNYLDVMLNLNEGSYRPYKKPNEETNYILVIPDHPPSILKQLPKSIEKRLSSLSSSKEFSKKLRHTMNSTSHTVETKKS